MTRLPVLFLCLAVALTSSTAAFAQKSPPYWASIDEREARMRTGPSTEYPTVWIYRRERLPLKVLARYKVWRKVEDPDGTQGWMHARLLTERRTAMVVGEEVVTLHASPGGNAKVTWRAEPGVVGRITECARGWCLFDVTGRQGYVPTAAIWGDEPLGE